MNRDRAWFSFCVAACLCVAANPLRAQTPPAQNAAPATKPATVRCSVSHAPPSDAEKALTREDYVLALDLFNKMETSAPDISRAGVIRTLIEQNKVKDADDLATTWLTQAPTSSAAKETMAEVLYRKGQLPQAFTASGELLKSDPCNARAHLLFGVIEHLIGNYATWKKQIDAAYQLAPTDLEIHDSWVSTLSRAKRIEQDTALLDEDILSEKKKAQLAEYLAHQKDYKKDDCKLTAPVEQTSLPIQPIMYDATHRQGLALDVIFNGKRRRLEIDTGASGIVLFHGAASGLKLARDQKITVGGVGDQGDVASSIAHVQSIRVGSLEFNNCPVEIVEKNTALDIDGLIGGNFFLKYLITLDFRTMKMNLDPLPKRPEETAVKSDDEDEEDDTPVFHDRYIAPDMKDWTKVYRVGHEMLLPVSIGPAKDKLFLIDSGSAMMAISPSAAREVTKVGRDMGSNIIGISGEVKKVYSTGEFTLVFAHLGLKVDNISSFDTTNLSHDTGVEVSGFLGAPVLNRLALHIDYRDDLVKFDYDPKNDPINYAH